MKTLNIVRSNPDEMTKKLIETFSQKEGDTVFTLFDDVVDWSALVDEVFAHDKIICWW